MTGRNDLMIICDAALLQFLHLTSCSEPAVSGRYMSKVQDDFQVEKKHEFGVGFIAAPRWQCHSTGIRVLDPWNLNSRSSVFRVSNSKRWSGAFMSQKKKDGGVGFLQIKPPDWVPQLFTWSLVVTSWTEQSEKTDLWDCHEFFDRAAISPGHPASHLINHSNGLKV